MDLGLIYIHNSFNFSYATNPAMYYYSIITKLTDQILKI